jgi:hypothetical protein
MINHEIFYYPYCSFKDDQGILLKAAAMYFDKLYILDPVKASWDIVGAENVLHNLKLLQQEGILVRISPEEVLHKFEKDIAEAIRFDIADPDFLRLCETSPKTQWTLALAKIPREIRDDPHHQQYKTLKPRDKAMQRLLGELPGQLSSDLGQYDERYYQYPETTDVYDEYREGDKGALEYRYADYPLSIGEAIMMNHALFGSFLYTGGTPLTDDSFHNEVLNLKIQRAYQIPAIKQILEDRARQRQLKRDQLAMTLLTDMELPIISSQLPLEEILQYRQDCRDDLQQARQELGLIAREIQEKPWSKDFADHLETKTIPQIHRQLLENKKARDSWFNTNRGKKALSIAGLTVTAASSVISLALSATPLLPVAVTTGILGIVSGVGIPGAEMLLDWKSDRQKKPENGLHYFLKFGDR